MNRARYLLVAVAAAAACTGTEPGGGGVNIDDTTTTAVPVTTTTLAPTTTSTLLTMQISGRVSSHDGSPVARAQVTMADLQTVSGPDGWFSFETSRPGAITVAKPGWSSAELVWDVATTYYEATISPQRIRGLRVAPEAARDDAKFASLIQLANETAVNALVFDTKQEGGNVLYDTEVQVAHDIGAVEPFYDPQARVEQAHANGLYTITRIVAFEDSRRVAAFPEEKLAGPWLDPASRSARDYVHSLAAEACEIGFDEIQFDYVRYPSGLTAKVSGQLEMTQERRIEVIAGFLAEAREILHPLGCAVSADVFGIVVSTPDDQGLGQRPEELSVHLDALSPMVYPSHYSLGWLGFADPNDHPYEVTADAISDALPRMEVGSQLRPYLQGFYWSNEQIGRAIQAAEDLGVGWILWNVRSNFDREAIPSDAEVATP